MRRAQLQGELAGERRQAERIAAERAQSAARASRLRAQLEADSLAAPRARRLAAALAAAAEAVQARVAELEQELAADGEAGERMAGELRDVRRAGGADPGLAARLRRPGDRGRGGSPAPARSGRGGRARADGDIRAGWASARTARAKRLRRSPWARRRAGLRSRVERLTRRREQLGPVNPLAQEEYAEALAHVEELESQRTDLETALRELQVGDPRDRPPDRGDVRADVHGRGPQLRRTRQATCSPGARAACGSSGKSRRRARCLGGEPLPEGRSRRRGGRRRRGGGGELHREEQDCRAWRSRSRPRASRPSACRCSPAARSR